MKTYIYVLFVLFLFNISLKGNEIEVIAHRGASAYKLENSLSAFKYAFELGADAIELDIWMTKDRKIVIAHDRNTKRIANKDLIIPESSYDEIRSLKLNNNEQIPTLEEVLSIVPPGKKVYIEIKCAFENGEAGNIFPEIIDVLNSSGRVNDCSFISFNHEALIKSRVEMPDVPTYFLSAEKNHLNNIIDIVKTNSFTGLDIHYPVLESNSSIFKEEKMSLIVWTVNSDEEIKRMLNNPLVRAITTDKPDRVLKLMKK